jgi:hypothetical protein
MIRRLRRLPNFRRFLQIETLIPIAPPTSGTRRFGQLDRASGFGLFCGGTLLHRQIEIEWPYPKSSEVISGLKADQFATITEGRGVKNTRDYHGR